MSGASRWLPYRGLLGPVVVGVLFGIGVLWSPFEPHRPPDPGAEGAPGESLVAGLARAATGAPGSESAAAAPAGPSGRVAHATTGSWDDEDWTRFVDKVRWSAEAGLDTLPLGTAMARLGRTFVGTPYVPGTLEVEPERVVVDFGGLDCVTFVETVFATTRFVRAGGAHLVEEGDRPAAQALYESLLAEIRYRDGAVGYPTRLHYFSDWIADNARRGLVEELTPALGGVPDTEPIDFMTAHPGAYRQLANPAFLDEVRAREAWLSGRGRTYVPEDRIADAAAFIHEGDVIAATSTVPGLDVAHTGLAVLVDGALHLLHAPLVGEAVQISEVPLADRILRLQGQDGIMVARPVDGSR